MAQEAPIDLESRELDRKHDPETLQQKAPSQPPSSPTRANAQAITFTFTPLTGRQKLHYYLKTAYGPASLLQSVAGAGVNQARDHPTEWGQGMGSYGRRFAAKYSHQIFKRSLQIGVATLLQEDPRYFHSQRTGLWSRTAYAITQTFIIYRNDGRRKFADSRFIGAFGAGFISRTWYPERYHTVTRGLESGSVSIAIDAGMNVFKEFWPDIKRKIRR